MVGKACFDASPLIHGSVVAVSLRLEVRCNIEKRFSERFSRVPVIIKEPLWLPYVFPRTLSGHG